MTSDSEHTNRQRPPQQARGHKWPILVLLLSLAALTLALAACGGSSSTSAPDATTGSPATATSTPASTPTPEPTEVAAVGEGAGISRETREYIEAFCALPIERVATWGEYADQTTKVIDFAEKNKPPRELQDYFEAYVALGRLIVRLSEEHRSLSFASGATGLWEDSEVKEASQTHGRAYEALDDAVREALSCS